MNVENPYLNSKRLLIVAIDKEKDPVQKKILQEKLDSLLLDERRWLKNKLSELQDNINDMSEKLQETKEKAIEKEISKKELKKISIDLYRQIVGYMKDGEIIQEGLVQKARKLKRMLR